MINHFVYIFVFLYTWSIFVICQPSPRRDSIEIVITPSDFKKAADYALYKIPAAKNSIKYSIKQKLLSQILTKDEFAKIYNNEIEDVEEQNEEVTNIDDIDEFDDEIDISNENESSTEFENKMEEIIGIEDNNKIEDNYKIEDKNETEILDEMEDINDIEDNNKIEDNKDLIYRDDYPDEIDKIQMTSARYGLASSRTSRTASSTRTVEDVYLGHDI